MRYELIKGRNPTELQSEVNDLINRNKVVKIHGSPVIGPDVYGDESTRVWAQAVLVGEEKHDIHHNKTRRV